MVATVVQRGLRRARPRHAHSRRLPPARVGPRSAAALARGFGAGLRPEASAAGRPRELGVTR
eukprot:5465450-Prymnesium_polylepis.1